jgi:hypothetical protein
MARLRTAELRIEEVVSGISNNNVYPPRGLQAASWPRSGLLSSGLLPGRAWAVHDCSADSVAHFITPRRQELDSGRLVTHLQMT